MIPTSGSRRDFLNAASLAWPLTAGVASIAACPTAGAGQGLASGPNDSRVEPIAAFVKGSRILFQGDSITDGNRGRGTDPNHILGHGYVFLIAAKFGAAFPELDLNFVNRGISGNTVLHLAQRWQKDTVDLKPDLLSILIGVNDSSRGIPTDQYGQIYDTLLAEANAANPNLKLVLCEPFTLPVGNKKNDFEAWEAGIKTRREIVALRADRHHAAPVHFQRAFDEACNRAPANHGIWDGVHPTYSGHQIMADEWERTVRASWPAFGR